MTTSPIQNILRKITMACQQLQAKVNGPDDDKTTLDMIYSKAQEALVADEARRLEIVKKLKNYLGNKMAQVNISSSSNPWAGTSIFDTEVKVDGQAENLLFLIDELREL